ncbi:hypothetical protein Desaci_1087 [Desulfosporosinus acidiphilus SJ4]|uniref:Uncharacterized protein n=1 Tax=Desulfosporosinus acidiphilus (strain DSM 22704 / JCM 16185 / SJ4) TaxID=646529 RepID=I4D2V2_DESAJ|nr:hypothetical protein [Desulfosporosinus acidiphilus]AFM40126.1 hypothetical protein Desaci_1087 [Desulfosporosinus acidiphilus SJ4]
MMSGVKLLYDVINTMKDKEVISGTLKVEGTKDQSKIIGFQNEFVKNLTSGETKVKISSELDYDGKKIKHESQTEFTLPGCRRHMHHGFMKHHHHFYHHGECGIEGHENLRNIGIRGKLAKLAFVLNVINQIKMEEQEDQSVKLSLNLKEIPEEMKKAIQEKMSQRRMPEHQQHHFLLKEFFTMQEPNIQCNLWVSKTKEIERILLTAEGKQNQEADEIHKLQLTAELQLS